MNLNKEQIEILKHTANNNNGLYCGDSLDMQILCQLNLMEYAGRKSFVPDPYFKITSEGKRIVNQRGEYESVRSFNRISEREQHGNSY